MFYEEPKVAGIANSVRSDFLYAHPEAWLILIPWSFSKAKHKIPNIKYLMNSNIRIHKFYAIYAGLLK